MTDPAAPTTPQICALGVEGCWSLHTIHFDPTGTAFHARSTPAAALDEATTVERCPICNRPEKVRLVDNWQQEGRVPIIGCGNPWHYDGLYRARLHSPESD